MISSEPASSLQPNRIRIRRRMGSPESRRAARANREAMAGPLSSVVLCPRFSRPAVLRRRGHSSSRPRREPRPDAPERRPFRRPRRIRTSPDDRPYFPCGSPTSVRCPAHGQGFPGRKHRRARRPPLRPERWESGYFAEEWKEAGALTHQRKHAIP